MIKLAISGAHGRMGQAISQLAFADKDFEVTTLLEHSAHPQLKEPINGIAVTADNTALAGCNALIEFTLPDGTKVKRYVTFDDTPCIPHELQRTIPGYPICPEFVNDPPPLTVDLNLFYWESELASPDTMFPTFLIIEKAEGNMEGIRIETIPKPGQVFDIP